MTPNCATLAAATTFGTACSVYSGTTTVDGRDAMVFTWYRLPMFDNTAGGADESLFLTFQILLIKLDTPDPSNGYDFEFEFNYGAVNDPNGGYSAADPTTACNFSVDLSDCRFAVGVGKYSTPGVEGGVASGFEFLSQYPTSELLDGGSRSLVTNSMNSTVGGRYVCYMVSGDQVGCDGKTPELPDTGVDAATATGIAVGALALFALGGALVVARRRRA
jgi:LPXTG-motif cell wall-anchored protein